MKHIRIWLLAALAVVSSTVLADKTVTWQPPSNSGYLTSIAVDEIITLTWAEGSGDQSPYYNNGIVTFYNGNRITVSCAEDVTITKIAFHITNKDGDYGGLVTCDASGRNENADGISADRTHNICTWVGETNSVTFRAPARAGNRKISAIEVTYITEEPPLPLVFDLAVTAIEGSIDLALGENSLTVKVKNNGNQDISDATLTLTAGELVLGTTTITVVVGEEGSFVVPVSTEGLLDGNIEVTAQVTVDDDATPDDNTLTETVTVIPVPIPDVFDLAITAIEGSIDLALEENSLTVKVKNNGNQDISEATLTLTAGELMLGTTTITVVVGEEGSFVVPVSTEGLVDSNIEVTAQVTVADEATPDDNTLTETVTVIAVPIPDVFDLAVTAIEGSIDLALEENSLTVSIKNNGNQDISDATLILTAGELVLGTTTITVSAGEENSFVVPVSTEGLVDGDINVTALLTVADDATPDDNTLILVITVMPAPDPIPTAVAAVKAGRESTVKSYTLGGRKALIKHEHNPREKDRVKSTVKVVYKGKVYIVHCE